MRARDHRNPHILQNIVAWTDLHSGLASWVQAIGSIAAIAGAAGIAAWETGHERRRIARRKARFDRRFDFQLRDLASTLDALSQSWHGERPETWPRTAERMAREIRYLNTYWRNIDPDDLDSLDQELAVADLVKALEPLANLLANAEPHSEIGFPLSTAGTAIADLVETLAKRDKAITLNKSFQSTRWHRAELEKALAEEVAQRAGPLP
jgi:hypothetical protein